MIDEEKLQKIIEEVNHSVLSFCKFLSTNDTIRKNSHQCGIYIPNDVAAKILFGMELPTNKNVKIGPVRINWQFDAVKTDSKFTYYGASKNECRITCFGRGFPFLRDNDIGDIFILIKVADKEYNAYLLTTDEEIGVFLDYFGMSPVDTNALIRTNAMQTLFKMSGIADYNQTIPSFPQITNDKSHLKQREIKLFVERVKAQFPEARIMSQTAREIYDRVYDHKENICDKPDEELIAWIDLEFELFSSLEDVHYYDQVHHGFVTMDDFIETANSVLNRRKSRAGKSLENNLSALFLGNNLSFEEQVITELNKKPDFVFPSGEAYHNLTFSADKLIVLGAKTTCKDRWRQVITEAGRVKHKYLCTLQQGNSSQQLLEMRSEDVTLVVPKPYIKFYPKEYRENIMDLRTFIAFVKEKETL